MSGNVSMRDYHGYCKKDEFGRTVAYGALQTYDGVRVTGTFGGGDYGFSGSFLKDFVLEEAEHFGFSNGWMDYGELNRVQSLDGALFSGSTVTNSVFNTLVVFDGGSTISHSVINDGVVFLMENTVGDIVINSGYALGDDNQPYAILNLIGDIRLNYAGSFIWNSVINVNGYTVTVDYTNRTVRDGGMFSLSNFSEDANFRLLFQEDQKIGTYTIAWNAGSFVDYFLMNIGGVDTEELSFENPEMTYGNYHYTMAHDVETQYITLSIDVAEGIVAALKGEPVMTAVNMAPVSAQAMNVIKPFFDLAERLGCMATALAEGAVTAVEVEYTGEITDVNTKLLTTAVLRGMLTPILETNVNFVNAPGLAKEDFKVHIDSDNNLHSEMETKSETK